MRSLRDSWQLGGVTVPNRVVLAPLAGIGNWFVRLQAKRYGAGLAISEMISSHAVHYGNRRTLDELLVIHPDERAGGPVAFQLFGQDPAVMRSAAAAAAARGADLIDLNMGCPVPKVMKTGAGAALIADPDAAVAVARAAAEGSGLPVTVKLRASVKPGGTEGLVAGPAARGGRGRGRAHHPPAGGRRPPQGHAGLRAGRAARGGAARARHRVGRHGGRGAHARRVRVHRLRGGHARARRAGQPVAVRAGPRDVVAGAHRTTRSSRSGTG